MKRLSLTLPPSMCLLGLVLVLFGISIPPVQAQNMLVDAAFTGASETGWLFGRGRNTSALPCLTAAPSTVPNSIPACPDGPFDETGAGALRLTPSQNFQASFVIFNQAVPSGQGYLITFDMFIYNGSSQGADGVSFFLIAGDANPETAGGFGGSLGYAPHYNQEGLEGGYIGLGFDEFGNFSNPTEGRTGGPGFRRNAVALRGAGAGKNGYVFLTKNEGDLPARLDFPKVRTRSETIKRRVRIALSAINQISVDIDFQDGEGFVPVLPPYDLNAVPSQPAFPESFKFGFAASTGALRNIHEIRNLSITTNRPDLSVTQAQHGSWGIGQESSFVLSVQNAPSAGPTADPITLVDEIPEGLDVIGTAGDGWACTVNSQTVTCTYAAGAASGETLPDLTITVRANNSLEGTPINAVSVSTPQEAADALANNTSSEALDLPIDLAIDLTANPTSAATNDPVTLTVTVTNAGPSDASGVAAAVPLPEALTFIRAQSNTGHFDARTGLWQIGDLAKDETATLSLETQLTAPSGFAVVARITAADQPDSDSDLTNDDPTEDDIASTTITANSADLSITIRSDNVYPAVNDEVIYTITVKNDGPLDATGVQARNALPFGLTYVSSSVTTGMFDPLTGIWNVGDLRNNATATLTVRVQVTIESRIENIAFIIFSDQPDPDSVPATGSRDEDDEASALIIVGGRPIVAGEADLSLAVITDNPFPRVGETVTLTHRLTNEGPDTANNIAVGGVLPVGLTRTNSNTSHGTYDPDTQFWTLNQLSSGATVELTLQAQVTVSSTLAYVAEVLFADQLDPDSEPGNGAIGEDDLKALELNVLPTEGVAQVSAPHCEAIRTVNAFSYDAEADLVFAGTENGLLHGSYDNGQNWPILEIIPNETPIRALLTSGSTTYAGTWGHGVYFSAGGGQSWQPIGPADVRVGALAFDTGTNVLYAGLADGVYTYMNDTWDLVGASSNPFSTTPVIAVAYETSTDDVIAAGEDGSVFRFDGTTWISQGNGLPPGPVRALLVTQDGSLLAGTNGAGVYRFRSDTQTWIPFGAGLPLNLITTLAEGPQGIVLAGTRRSGLFAYNTAEDVWTQVPNLPSPSVNAVTVTAQSEFFASTPSGGIYHFADNDGNRIPDTWFQVSDVLTAAPIQGLVAAPNGDLFAASYGYGVLYSQDGGQCWLRANNGLTNPWTFALERTDSGTLFAGAWADGLGGVWRSTDNATNWDYIGLGREQILALAVHPVNDDIVLAGGQSSGTQRSGAVWLTTDGGANWDVFVLAEAPIWALALDPTNPSLVYAGTRGEGLFVSTDGGRQWARMPDAGDGNIYELNIGPLGTAYAGVLFAATGTGVYTYDAPANAWERFGNGLANQDIRTLAFAPRDVVYAGTLDQGAFILDPGNSTLPNASQDWVPFGLEDLPITTLANDPTNGTVILGTATSGLFLGTGETSGVAVVDDDMPTAFTLRQNYPNPFNPSTTITFSLARSTHAQLTIYDMLGRQVTALIDGPLAAGRHQVTFQARDLASGTYFYRLTTPTQTLVKMMTLVK